MANHLFDLGEQLPTLNSPPLRLRWLTSDDIPALFAIFSDVEVTRYWGTARFTTLADAEKLLASIQSHFRERTLFQWGIELAEIELTKSEPTANNSHSKIIGTTTLASLDPINRRAELGFALGREYWGNGYGRIAAQAALTFAFEKLNLHRVAADTDPRNAPSIRTLESLGFRREGYLREHYLVTGEVQDGVIFGLLRSEWQANPPSCETVA